MDVDGDQLNCVYDDLLIRIAERNLEKYDIVPLLYELGKAGSSPINDQEFYAGLKRAHDYSGIGQISNSLTKLWNKEHPDRYVAGLMTYYNNLTIDAAKTGYINSYENYPAICKRINKAIGGKHGRMPFFFQFSKNGRTDLVLKKSQRKKCLRQNGSTMNRLCERFMHIGNIRFNLADVKPFNWQMLLPSNQEPYNAEAVQVFCDLDDANTLVNIEAQLEFGKSSYKYEFLKQEIIDEMTLRFGNIDSTYSSIVKYLFAGDNFNKQTHKQMFWRVYGNIACHILSENMAHYSECPRCGMKIPAWSSSHDCPKNASGFLECVDCGRFCKRINSKQCRCEDCQAEYRRQNQNRLHRMYYKEKK